MAVKQMSEPADAPLQSEAAMPSQTFHYSPWRFLQTMFAIAWSAFAHPLSATVIDLTTGEVRHNAGEDEA